jgi:CheY-like chemotaxis protein
MPLAHPQLGKSPPALLRRVRLVVADDERDTVETLSAILVDEGYDVVGAATGAEVLRLVRQERPDALILDIDMPGMSGYTLAREMRNIFDPPPLLVAISGKWVGQTDQMLASLAGFDHFLRKPCDPKVLLQLLQPLSSNPAS